MDCSISQNFDLITFIISIVILKLIVSNVAFTSFSSYWWNSKYREKIRAQYFSNKSYLFINLKLTRKKLAKLLENLKLF